ncbi:MAG: AAA family ATPase [Methylophagaceae bacterium]|jgi:adenylylsulfate kinase|tara:strand:+ start:647 stop:1069 length:423 start_codon:yes stop_codon:yes gene_type:complete
MKKILIFGLPGSGKSYLAEPLAEELGGVWINADQVRKQYDDWDFSDEGRMRQALRMKFLSEGVVRAGKFAITDFVCPFEKARVDFAPDYSVWMDTIKEGRFEDTNKIFEKPESVDHIVHTFRSDVHVTMARIIKATFKVD